MHKTWWFWENYWCNNITYKVLSDLLLSPNHVAVVCSIYNTLDILIQKTEVAWKQNEPFLPPQRCICLLFLFTAIVSQVCCIHYKRWEQVYSSEDQNRENFQNAMEGGVISKMWAVYASNFTWLMDSKVFLDIYILT